MARPIAILVALALLLAAIVAGALAAGGALRGDPQLRGDPATVVAQYAEIHVGWVYLYADGRAVYHPDGPTHERRLTQTGVDLVRSGAVPVSAVLKDPGQLPTRAWADAEARLYEPAKYAICYGILAAAGWSGDPNANEPSFGEPSPADGSFDLVIDPELVLPHGVIQGWGG